MDPRNRPVRDVMETEVAVLEPGERLDLADDIMRLGRVRHMPVVEDGRVVGVVSSHDVLAASLTKVLDFEASHRRTFMRGVEVSEVMTRDPVTLEPDATLREAASILRDRRIHCLPVVKPDGTLLGLVTETDLLRAVFGDEEAPEATAEEEAVGPENFRTWLAAEVDAVREARDELRVRMHLARADARDLWDETEHKLRTVEARLKAASSEAEEPLHEIGTAARLLLDEIREGYRRIRDAL